MKIKELIKKINWYIVILIAIVLAIAILNYTPGTILTGWDNLHAEFNWQLNFERTLSSTWQEYQGLGIVPGMAHGAELSRLILLFPLQLALPLEMVRWMFLWITLISGVVGMYYLTREIFLKKLEERSIKDFGAFAAGLFYLLNLGTLQNFYAPSEIFTIQYALLPWILLSIFKYIEKPTYRRLLAVTLFSFFATSMAITQTLFIPYAILVASIFIANLKPLNKENSKKLLKLSFVLVVSNLFWVIPTIYSIPTKSGVVLNSKISQIVSDDAFQLSVKTSTVDNFPTLEGVWFESLDLEDEEQPFAYMMSEWRTHVNEPIIKIIGFVIFAFILFGLVVSFKKKINNSYVLLTAFIASLIMLLGETPPTGYIFSFIRDLSPVIGEIFRFPFTKFSIIAIFAFSGYFGIGASTLFGYLYKNKIIGGNLISKVVSSFILAFPIVLFMLPVFQGFFVYDKLQVELPNEYIEMFDWFEEKDDNGRILHLPMHTFLGWLYYDWGYRGSGFLWYGIEQPIVDRAFDVWSVENEGAYLEFSNSIYSGNTDQFDELLRKYNIKYVLLDRNVISVGQEESELLTPELDQVLKEKNDFFLSKEFGDIQIYEFRNETSVSELITNPTVVKESSQWKYRDDVYENNSNYISNMSKFDTVYPFDSLEERSAILEDLNSKEKTLMYINNSNSDLNLNIDKEVFNNTQDFRYAKVSIDKADKEAILNIENLLPEILIDDKVTQSNLMTKTQNININLEPSTKYISIGNNVLELESIFTPKVLLIPNEYSIRSYSESSSRDFIEDLSNKRIEDCSGDIGSSREVDKTFLNNTIQIKANNTTGCLSTDISDLFNGIGEYIIEVDFDFKSDTGNKSDLCLRNSQTLDCVYQSNDDLENNTVFIEIKEQEKIFLEVFITDNNNQDAIPAVANYSNIEISTFSSDVKNSIDTQLPVPIYPNPTIKPGEQLKLKLNQELPILIENSLIDVRASSDSSTCNLRESSDSKINTSRNFDKFGEYTEWFAFNASNCDFFAYDSLPQNLHYLVFFNGLHIQGEQIRLYLQNNENKRNNSIYDLDFSTENVSTEVVYLPPSVEDKTGYTFNIENSSETNKSSINRIYNTEILPLDVNFLKSINLERENNIGESTFRQLNTNKDSITRFETFVGGLSENSDNYLFFNQSFDKGWTAYHFDNKPNLIQRLFPSLFSSKVGGHTKANNWANAWKIDKEGYYLIVYSPQILQTASLALFGLTVIVLIYKSSRKSVKNQQLVYTDYGNTNITYTNDPN